MANCISLGKLLSLNVRDIEDLFGKERLPEILGILRTNKKIIEKDAIEEKLKEIERDRKELAKKLILAKNELESMGIAY
ncbi:MAG: hypothetical protein WC788_01080 [Candidatus Paceibacterota bacterium]|jgi:hypothetical protein